MTKEKYKKLLQDLLEDKMPDFDTTIEYDAVSDRIHVNGDYVDD